MLKDRATAKEAGNDRIIHQALAIVAGRFEFGFDPPPETNLALRFEPPGQVFAGLRVRPQGEETAALPGARLGRQRPYRALDSADPAAS